ncbi:MAG: aminoglycoside phosphotransferase family protein [Henriciella sp.]
MDFSEDLARTLVDAQFPDYAELPIRAVASGGTDNAIFRLGAHLSVRLPKREDAVGQIEKEQLWLPRLAPLPLRIPTPVQLGAPSAAFPFPWSIYDWCPGVPLSQAQVTDWSRLARHLAQFLLALRAKGTHGAPQAGAQNHFRGVALAKRDALTQAALTGISDLYPAAEMQAIWHSALEAPKFRGGPVWLHGDLQGGNLLIENGLLAAVIDFGLCGVGDPAMDLVVAWSVLPDSVRQVFRQEIGADDAAWARGRGWALSVAAIALDYYRDRNPALSAISKQTIEAVLS